MSQHLPMPVSRRRFLKQLVVFGGATLLLPATVHAGEHLDSHGHFDWVVIGPESQFKKGKFTQVVLPEAYDEEVVYIKRSGDESYLALLARCTHKGCIVAWTGQRL